MKKLKLFLVPAFIAVMLVGFDACKSKDVAPAASIVGKWKWTSVNNKGLSAADYADWKTYQKSFASVVWEFKSNNEYSIVNTNNGYYQSDTYELKNGILNTGNDEGPVTITSTSMVWYLTDESVEYVFTRQ